MNQERMSFSVREGANHVLDITVNPVSSLRVALGLFHQHPRPEDFQFMHPSNGNFAVQMRHGVGIETVIGDTVDVTYLDRTVALEN